MTPRGRDPPHVTGGGSQEASSRDRGEGAREPVARPGPAPSSLALSTPGSGARRSHDLWGRGCRSERAGEPGAAATKAEEARRGRRRPPGRLRTLFHLCRSRPVGSREVRREAPGTRAVSSPPLGFHLRPGVCGGGEPDQQHPPPAIPVYPWLWLPLGTRGRPEDGGEPRPLACALSTTRQTLAGRGADV